MGLAARPCAGPAPLGVKTLLSIAAVFLGSLTGGLLIEGVVGLVVLIVSAVTLFVLAIARPFEAKREA